MADSVIARKLRDNGSEAEYLLCSSSDGTGETKVQKIDISGLAMAATKVQVVELKWSIEAMAVLLYFDRTTDDNFAILTGNGHLCEQDMAPISDNLQTGDTGDILLSSVVTAASIGRGYTIYIKIRKLA